MIADYPTDEAPATPEYVLAFINNYFQYANTPRRPLTADATFGEWFSQEEWVFRWTPFAFTQWAEDLREGLFDIFHLDMIEFRITRRTRVDEFCRLISEQLETRPIIRPWRPLVGESRAAGAFLALRSLLAKSGAEVSNLSPSTPLNDPRFGIALLEAIPNLIKLSPETCPVIGAGGRRRDSKRIPAALAIGVSLIVGAVAVGFAGLGSTNAVLIGCVGFVTALVAGILAVRAPLWPVIPGMSTYRVLAYALAGQQPPRRILPVDEPT